MRHLDRKSPNGASRAEPSLPRSENSFITSARKEVTHPKSKPTAHSLAPARMVRGWAKQANPNCFPPEQPVWQQVPADRT